MLSVLLWIVNNAIHNKILILLSKNQKIEHTFKDKIIFLHLLYSVVTPIPLTDNV
jgi:hypothetical protein